MKSNFNAYRLIWSGFSLYLVASHPNPKLEAIYLPTAKRNRKTLSEEDAAAIPFILEKAMQKNCQS